MEARTFRDGALRDDGVPLDRLRETIATLGAGDWVWVDGIDPSDEELEVLRHQLDLHDLVVEDIHHRGQRPKVEIYPQHVFAALRPLSLGVGELVQSELFAIASLHFLATLRFSPAFDLADAVHRWPILHGVAPGTGGAFYTVADEVADDYLEVVEQLEDRADELEAKVFRSEASTAAATPLQQDLLRLRRDTVHLRRHAVPMRQAIDRLADDATLVTPELMPYFRDITDHLLRSIELTDSVREVVTTVVDIRMAQSAHQLNEVMKKLTAWAGIILVPTLIAGVYGMNFEHMPELSWAIGYPLALGIMAASAALLYRWFKRRGWV
jgi:magnesium transporter